MTDVLVDTEPEDSPAEDSALVAEEPLKVALPTPADWSSRAGAFTIDVLLGLGVLVVFMFVAWSARVYSWLWWVCALVAAVLFLAIAANRLVLPVITGWSVGRSLFGLKVVRNDGLPNDPWRLLLRDMAHVLDTIPLLAGWFWPLWDSRGRTVADILARTEVHYASRPGEAVSDQGLPNRRQLATRLMAGLGALAVLGAGLGVLGVTLPERAVTAARKEIAEQGPKIVPDVLSYGAATVQQDFDRAQSLVTDAYRPQLVAQQDAIRKLKPILDNTYWVTNSAVLTSTRDHAQMLLLMQGQRGAESKQRFITASVRASFVKSGSGQWQVADLVVLAQPNAPMAQPNPTGQPNPPKSGQPSPAKPPAPSPPKKPAR